jgi:hypothetical protein
MNSPLFPQRISPARLSYQLEMRLRATWTLLALAFTWPEIAAAQLQLVPSAEPHEVFGGRSQNIPVTFRNDSASQLAVDLRTRLYQTTPAVAAPFGPPLRWKTLQIPPDQTVLELASLDLPTVKAETHFLIQWLDDHDHLLGASELRVYPANLLAELKPMLHGEVLGVLDPLGQLKPILKAQAIEFVDLADSPLDEFTGRLAIIGPFSSSSPMPDGLVNQIKTIARKNTAVVWLQSPHEQDEKLLPSFYSVPENTNSVVMVQPGLVSDPQNNPRAQLNLVALCRLALHQQPLLLSDFLSSHD